MALEGMDVEVVEGIGNKLKAQGDQIQKVITKVDSLVGQAEQNWKGNDANKFRSEWEGQYKGMLTAAKTEIDGLGTTAIAQAKEQQATSAN